MTNSNYNKSAIFGFILSIINFVIFLLAFSFGITFSWLVLAFAVISLILGTLSLRKIKSSKQRGKKLAIVTIIISIIYLLVYIFAVIYIIYINPPGF